MEELHAFWLIIRGDIYHLHALPFGVIAVAFGLLARNAVSVIFAALIAAFVYIFVQALIPTMTEAKAFVMPHFNHAFWHFYMSLSIAMVAAIGFVYGLKTSIVYARG